MKNKSVESCVCLQVYLYLCIINSQHNDMKAEFRGNTVECQFRNLSWEVFDPETHQWFKVKFKELKLWPGQIEVFHLEGCFFIGSFREAEKLYQAASPGKKFFIWICDNFTELKPIK